MQRNSGFLRLTLLTSYLLIHTFNTINTNPVRPRRMIREIYSHHDGSLHNASAISYCLMDGKQIDTKLVTCNKKQGCKEIQKTGECCPDYQCECKQDGKLYENGEKLVDSETPCRVCYCRGGEISCSPVTCYNRNDCEPKYIPGRCCPEYDNCPPLEHIKISSSKEIDSSSGEDKIPIRITNKPTTNMIPVTSTDKPQVLINQPIGIKIKEITKPEEIRITNDNQKIHKPILKISDMTTHSPPPSASISEYDDISSTINSNHDGSTIGPFTNTKPNSLDSTDDTDSIGDNPNSIKNIRQIDNGTNGTIDDQWINESKLSTSMNYDEMTLSKSSSTLSTSVSVDDLYLLSSTSEPNKIISNGNKQEPSILQIGNNVVIVNHKGQTQSITLIGAAGLQRGDDNDNEEEEIIEEKSMDGPVIGGNHESIDKMEKDDRRVFVHSTESHNDEQLLLSSDKHQIDRSDMIDLMSKEIFDDPVYVSTGQPLHHNNMDDVSTEFEKIDASSSQHIFITNGPSTTENDIDYTSSASATLSDHIEGSSSPFEDELLSNSGSGSVTGFSVTTFSINSDSILSGSGSGSISSTTTTALSSSNTNTLAGSGDCDNKICENSSINPTVVSSSIYSVIEDDEIDHYENIEFPKIPDDLSIHGSRMDEYDPHHQHQHHHQQQQQQESRHRSSVEKIVSVTPDEPEQTKILSEVLVNRSNVTTGKPNDSLNSSISDSILSESWLKNITTTEKINSIVATNNTQARAPGEPLLIPEWERNTTDSNSTIESEADEDYIENQTINSVYLDSSNIRINNNSNINSISDSNSNNSNKNVSSDNLSSTTEGTADSTSNSNRSNSNSDLDVADDVNYKQFIENPNINYAFDVVRDFFRYQQKIWNMN